MLHLRDSNLDGYRKICSNMLEHFGQGATRPGIRSFVFHTPVAFRFRMG
jgi:hypothetical protein